MSENTKPRGCGQREVIGHGQNHFCGDELWGEVVYCDSCNLKAAKARIAELEAALAAKGATQRAEARDREADRERFPDPDFNRWLDEVISDSGHIVWHQIGNIEDAWAAWDSRPYYAKGRHPLADAPEDELFHHQPEARVGGEAEPVAWRIFWSTSPLSAVELTSDRDRIAQVMKLAEDLRIEPLYTTPPAQQPAPVVPEGWRITPFTGSFGDGKWEVYAPCGSGGAVGESDIRHFAIRMLLDHMAAQHTKEN